MSIYKFTKIGLVVVSVLLLNGCGKVDRTNLGYRGDFGFFKRSLNTKPYGWITSQDITKTAPTENIEIFEVRPGDCSSDKYWSDCANDRERSELTTTKDNYPGNEYWYGWSIYFPKDYPNIYPTKTALGQFHQKSSHPVWMFQNHSGGYHLDRQVDGSSEKYYKLIDEKELRGKWHKIEVYARWSTGWDGFFKVWVDGTQKVDYSGQTMTASQVYFKYGIYRSFMSRYKNKFGVNKVPSQKVFYTNVKRGNEREELDVDY